MRKITTLLVLGLLFMIGACGSPLAENTAEPRSSVLICGGNACTSEVLVPRVEAWSAEAKYVGNSSLKITSLDGTQLLSVCVPVSWGGGVAEKRAQFVVAVGEAVKQLNVSPGVHVGSSGCTSESSDLRVVAPSVPESVRQALGRGQGTTHAHLAIVCDRSGSSKENCTNQVVGNLFDQFVITRPAVGSSFTVFVVGKTRDRAQVAWRFRLLASSSTTQVLQILKARDQAASMNLDLAGRGSAVAEAIDVAAAHLRDLSTGHRELVVLSDLREHVSEMSFEHRVPSPPAFVSWLQKRKLLPDLTHIAAAQVCGVHGRRGSAKTWTAIKGERLKKAWAAYFAKTGLGREVALVRDCSGLRLLSGRGNSTEGR